MSEDKLRHSYSGSRVEAPADIVPESRPGVKTLSEEFEEKIPTYRSVRYQFSSRDFLYILVFNILTAMILIINLSVNSEVVDIEQKHAYGLPLIWFIILTIITSLITAHMVYFPFVIDRELGNFTVIYALYLYLISQIFWSVTLFFTRTSRSTGAFASFLMLAALVWLGWVCYHYDRNSIYIFLILLIWTFYLQFYTLNVEAHPWLPIE